ncbi:MAG: Fe-S cluster assembly protein SufD [Rhodospirillales bacterium]
MTQTLDQPFMQNGPAPWPPGKPDWLAEARLRAFTDFKSVGLPTPKLEDWKYTRLTPLEDTRYRAAGAADGDMAVASVPSLYAEGDARPHRFVFVDGRPRVDLSDIGELPEGVIAGPLEDALKTHEAEIKTHLNARADGEPCALADLNLALMDSGFVLIVPKGVVLKRPVEVVYIGGMAEAPVAYFPRNLIVLGENAEAVLVKHHVGQGVGAYFANAVTDIALAQGARLTHIKAQAETLDATHTARTQVSVARDARYDSFSLAAGGRLSRNEINVMLNGVGAECSLNGVYMMRGSEHCDFTTRIEHCAPHTTSSEMFRGVLDDQARGVFQGKIVVHKGAQKIEGHQLSNTLLLSEGAEADAKPELEIYADDVKCSHGATTGRLDETALFYLRSRGIPEAQARNLLIQSFLGAVLETVTDERLREALTRRAADWLPAQCFRAGEWKAA